MLKDTIKHMIKVFIAAFVFLSAYNVIDVQAMGGAASGENTVYVDCDEHNVLSIWERPGRASEKVRELDYRTWIKVESVEQEFYYISFVNEQEGTVISGYITASDFEKYQAEEEVLENQSESEPDESESVEETDLLELDDKVDEPEIGEEGQAEESEQQPETEEGGEEQEIPVIITPLEIPSSEHGVSEEGFTFLQIPQGDVLRVYENAVISSDIAAEVTGGVQLLESVSVQYLKIRYNDSYDGAPISGYVEYEELLHHAEADKLSEVLRGLAIAPRAAAASQNISKPVILDISEHQPPSSVNYDKVAKEVDLVIVRIQQGTYIDKHYDTHITEFQKRGVPIHVYAYVTNRSSVESQAKSFYEKAQKYDPIMYWLDVEDADEYDVSLVSTSDIVKMASAMRKGIGNAKLGMYVGHHVYPSVKSSVSSFDALWLPAYGQNNGYVSGYPSYTCDLHQYTDKGRLSGYSGYLDLSRLTGEKELSFFTTKNVSTEGYYTTNPERIVTLKKANVYKSTTFSESTKTGKVIEKGARISVLGIEYHSSGIPRLKVSGGYITANEKYVSKYYNTNPGWVVMMKENAVYTSTTFSDRYKSGKTLKKGEGVEVLGMEYSASGLPRFKVEDGYIAANAKLVSQYYNWNPGTVITLTNVNVYDSTTFSDSTKTGNKLRKGQEVQVLGIEYTSSRIPRLKVEDGYITANIKYVKMK